MTDAWQRYQQWLVHLTDLDLFLDVSRMPVEESDVIRLADSFERAFEAMEALEAGSIANPDENRMVGHYWLRDPQRAPSPEISEAIARAWRRSSASPPIFTREGSARPRPNVSPICWRSASAARRWAPVRCGGPGAGSAAAPDPLHRQHRPGRHRPGLGRPGGTPEQHPGDRHQQIRRHAGTAQRHA